MAGRKRLVFLGKIVSANKSNKVIIEGAFYTATRGLRFIIPEALNYWDVVENAYLKRASKDVRTLPERIIKFDKLEEYAFQTKKWEWFSVNLTD